MKNKTLAPAMGVAKVVLSLTLLAIGGCSQSAVELTSYKDPYFPETATVHLPECYYREDPSGDLYLVGRQVTGTEAGPLTQYLCVHIFWKPKPGRTPVERTTTDALLRFVVAREDGVAVYSGTGFAFPKPPSRFAEHREFVIESSRLQLESARGGMGDLFGPLRITGTMLALQDGGRTANLTRAAEVLAAR